MRERESSDPPDEQNHPGDSLPRDFFDIEKSGLSELREFPREAPRFSLFRDSTSRESRWSILIGSDNASDARKRM